MTNTKDMREIIEKEAETFFEFPTDDRDHVTTVSCKLFAAHVLETFRPAHIEPLRSAAREMLSALVNEYPAGVTPRVMDAFEALQLAHDAATLIAPYTSAPAAVPDEAFNIIEGIRAELTWSGWRKTSSRDWVMDSLSELLSMLTASPAPEHSGDGNEMVAPDVSELEKAAQTLWRESYSCESDFIQAVVDAFSKQEEEEPVVQQHYPCGCVTCICEDDVQCQGCGGTSCDDFKGPSCGCTHLKEEAER